MHVLKFLCPSCRGCFARTPAFALLTAVAVAVAGASLPHARAATTIWSTDLNFMEFAGQPGGFESGNAVLQTAAPGGSVAVPRNYDVLHEVHKDVVTGRTVFGSGQDAQTDLTITTRVVDGSGGRWASVQAGKRPTTGYNGGALIHEGTSRSSDWAVVAMEFRFAAGMEISADQFALRLTSANGTCETYEWTMVTLGGVMDAPFTLGQIGGYRATDYSAMGSSTFYNTLGGVTGQPGTGQRLATGRSMSQYLTGRAAAPVSGGLVQPGWYAVDDFNAHVFDGPEADWDNPYAADGAIDDNLTITGESLGMDAETRISVFTVWIGVHDVSFDSSGDGFTATDGNPFVSIASLSLGFTPVPEPSVAGLALFISLWLNRRKRK